MAEKYCRECGCLLEIGKNIGKYRMEKNKSYICRSCWNEYMRNYLRMPINRKLFNERQKKKIRKQKLKVINLLGGKCVHCGETDWRCLQIDHIHGGGTKERKTHWGSGSNYYDWLLKELEAGRGFDKYQLLCANCNWIKKYENEEV